MTLMEFLLKNRENRGLLATLRQGLVPATETRAWPWLGRFDGIGQTPRARAVRTVAGLFGHHPENCDSGNMGDTCREFCRGTDEDPGKATDTPGPVGRRFGWLLAADAEEIGDRVTRIVLYAKSKGIPVNYAQLQKDLERWPRAREAWAGAFWAATQAKGHAQDKDADEGMAS
ncbi:MAG: type I-E CRISPR-associated protein Cse2/CasB [Desulfovibrionaceae bacterium]|nr:type I-E CRISPR-associated protein Cse2/CasB [Desulfovibrionaceae bacterium]